MNKKYRAAAGLVLLLLLLGRGLLAAQGGLTLSQAVELAAARNPMAMKAQLREERASLGLGQAQETVDLLVYLRDLGVPLPYSQQKVIDLTAAETASAQRLLARSGELVRDQLALEAQQKYLALRKARENLALARIGLERAAELKRLAEAAYRAGTVPRSDVLGAEAQLALAEAQVLAAAAAERNARMDLNKTLGNDLNGEITLAEPFALPETGEVDLESGLASALSHRFEIFEAQEAYYLKELSFNHAAAHLPPDDRAYRTAYLDLVEAMYNLQIARDNVTLQVHQLYNALEAMAGRLAALEKAVAYSAESSRLARLRYGAGVGTQAEVLSAFYSQSELENQLLQARYDHYLTYLQWLFATGRPVG